MHELRLWNCLEYPSIRIKRNIKKLSGFYRLANRRRAKTVSENRFITFKQHNKFYKSIGLNKITRKRKFCESFKRLLLKGKRESNRIWETG